jgi:tRNA nucleotidyltransferase (CCA-adding enzyme)
MVAKTNAILKEVLERVEPSDEEKKILENMVKVFDEKLKRLIVKMKNPPEIFIGGSYAKKTLIRKDKYDVDIFLRYGKNYDGKNISEITKCLLKDFKNVLLVHGSRDYFRINMGNNIFIELVPVKKVSSPAGSDNITDLSYSHVKYVNSKIKNKKILDEIKIAKAFCHANNCYGAESYIRGFSGYSLELLVYYYKGFLKMIKELVKDKSEKIIVDIEKKYKNKKDVLIDMNSSKLESPIILVDPTFPQRNALAALSYETFERFKKACGEFLKNPTIKSFEKQKVNLEQIKKNAQSKKHEFILIEITTEKQEGDIAGSKLLKFYNHLTSEVEKFYELKNKGFNYNGKKSARAFYVLQRKKEIIYFGPYENDEKNVKMFKKEHKNIFVKNKRLFAREKVNFSAKEFFSKWKVKNKRRIKEMSVVGMEFVENLI